MAIVDVMKLEIRSRRRGAEIFRIARWRVQSDDPYEDSERVMAAPFVYSASKSSPAGWNTTVIPALPMRKEFRWGDANDPNAPTKPGVATKGITDDKVLLTDVEAFPEIPIDSGDAGHRFWWLVVATWMSFNAAQRIFGINPEDGDKTTLDPTITP